MPNCQSYGCKSSRRSMSEGIYMTICSLPDPILLRRFAHTVSRNVCGIYARCGESNPSSSPLPGPSSLNATCCIRTEENNENVSSATSTSLASSSLSKLAKFNESYNCGMRSASRNTTRNITSARARWRENDIANAPRYSLIFSYTPLVPYMYYAGTSCT
ncbi:unnamed protein product [Peniophora sp. CBMAI 1063]|nr:unnamed protein product [Peniophora sp. CBMAI 1063]